MIADVPGASGSAIILRPSGRTGGRSFARPGTAIAQKAAGQIQHQSYRLAVAVSPGWTSICSSSVVLTSWKKFR